MNLIQKNPQKKKIQQLDQTESLPKEVYGMKKDTLIDVSYFWTNQGNARHVCLGKHESPDITEHNNNVFKLLRSWIEKIVMKDEKANIPALPLVEKAIKTVASDFYNGEIEKAVYDEKTGRIKLHSFDKAKIVSKTDRTTAFSGLENFDPKFSIEESGNYYIIALEVPSLDQQYIGINIGESDMQNHWGLVVYGEIPKPSPDVKIKKSNRQFGPFRKRFDIPITYKRATPEMSSADGVVALVLEKQLIEDTVPKQPRVKSFVPLAKQD